MDQRLEQHLIDLPQSPHAHASAKRVEDANVGHLVAVPQSGESAPGALLGEQNAKQVERMDRRQQSQQMHAPELCGAELPTRATHGRRFHRSLMQSSGMYGSNKSSNWLLPVTGRRFMGVQPTHLNSLRLVFVPNLSFLTEQTAGQHVMEKLVTRSNSIITTNASFGFTGGVFGFDVSGPSGASVVIQGSTDLQTWIPLQTNLLGSGPLHFSDAQSPANTRRFYRVELSP